MKEKHELVFELLKKRFPNCEWVVNEFREHPYIEKVYQSEFKVFYDRRDKYNYNIFRIVLSYYEAKVEVFIPDKGSVCVSTENDVFIKDVVQYIDEPYPKLYEQ